MDEKTKSVLEVIPQSALFQKVGDICAAVNRVVDAKELLELSLRETMELFGASRGSIFMLDDNGKDLTLKVAYGMKSEEERNLVKRMGEGIVGKVAQQKRPIFVDDIANDKFFLNFKARKSYRTPSFICAPLLIKDQLMGVINITDKESGHRFSKEEMQLLDFLSSQIALNYRRIQLYTKFKTILKETQSLKDRLGKSDQKAEYLKKQIYIQEKLATIGKLAGGIAHEFNNPLDGVMRYTNLCLEHIKEDEVVRGYLLEIKQGLKRMANIVKNLLACSRNEAPRKSKIDFQDALIHSLIGLKSEIAYRGIQVEQKIQEKIPPIRDLGLEMILTNLLRNAIDAVHDGGKIKIKAKQTNGLLNFQVSDTGRGIPRDDVQQIFEPFYTTKGIDKGCGLGLTIVGEVVKSYDGKIGVESKPGKGTTFTIKLPVE